MDAIKTILLVCEGPDPASPAVARTVSIARASGASVHLLSPVYEPLLKGYMGNEAVYAPLRRRLVEESQTALDSLAQAIRERGPECGATAVWAEHRHETIARAVAADGADLVVIVPSGPGGSLSHADWTLISSCPASVLIVRGTGDRDYEQIVAAVDPYHEHGKPAELDTTIARTAKRIADLYGSRLTIVHCFTPLGDFVAGDVSTLPAAQAEAALERARQDALEQIVSAEGISTDCARLLAGRPEKVLASLAERGEADLFVLGVASRGRIQAFFIGSTAERLLHTADTDTLVVKPQDPDLSLAAAMKA